MTTGTPLLDVTDAVVSELNGRSWSQTFTAVRQNIPSAKREEMSNLSVIVSPKSRTETPVTRDRTIETLEIYVGVQKGLAGETNAESDPLISFGDEISQYFRNGRVLASYPTAKCLSSTFGSGSDSPWMNVKDQDEVMLFRGIVVISFQLTRAVP